MTTAIKMSRVVTNMDAGYRPLYASWNQVSIKNGIAPTKVWPSRFVDHDLFPGANLYWRDVPKRQAMTDRVNDFLKERQLSVNKDVLLTAKHIVQEHWEAHYGTENKVQTLKTAIDLLPSATSAGLPFDPGVKKGDARRFMLKLAAKQWQRVRSGKCIKVMPCRAGARRQLRLVGENKPRLIWAYPGYISLLENQFLAAISSKPPAPFIGWSINWLDRGRSLERVLHKDRSGWGAIAQLDFSKFDSTVPELLIRYAFDVLRGLFTLTREERIMFNNLEYYFIHTPILMYDEVVQKHRGIPSGSTLTQIIGSICNQLMCVYCDNIQEYTMYLDYKNSCWLGDDSLLYFEEGLAKDEFNRRYVKFFSHFGVEVNIEKSNYLVARSWHFEENDRSSENKIKFLGRIIDPKDANYCLDFDKFDAQVVWPEDEDKSVHDTGNRLIGLAWAYGMHYETYLRLARAYAQLKLVGNVVDEGIISARTKRNVKRYVTMFLSDENLDLTSFPGFEQVSERYFDNVHISRSYRTKNVAKSAPWTCGSYRFPS